MSDGHCFCEMSSIPNNDIPGNRTRRIATNAHPRRLTAARGDRSRPPPRSSRALDRQREKPHHAPPRPSPSRHRHARVPHRTRSLNAWPHCSNLAKPHTANGIRTRVTAVRGRRPSPLDDGGLYAGSRLAKHQARPAFRRTRCGRPRGGWCDIFALHLADVAELVDAHGSGPCVLWDVEVQVLSSAL